MRKVGKYEKMRKRALLQTYITSLLCLVLCVTMFFGTTAAWFTDTTTSEINQIHVGTLAVDLGFTAVTKDAVVPEAYTQVNESVKIFDDTIHWEPGYTAIRKFQLTEKGDLAFSYQMGIDFTYSTDAATKAKEEAVAQAISVWQYVGDNAAGYTLPADFETMTVDNEDEWVLVGTLKDVIDNHAPVFSGKMDKTAAVADETKAYHLIALNMDKTYGNDAADLDIQGTQLNGITIKLVATQLPSEQDAFGDTYDRMPANIVVVKEVKKDANNKVTEKIELAATNNSAVSYASVEIPAGAEVASDATTLTLKVEEKKNPTVTISADRKVLPLDIKVEGLSTDNNQVIPVKLMLDKGLNNVELYHNGEAMIANDSKADNTFTYNAETGELVLYVKKFSPFDVVYGNIEISDGIVKVGEGEFQITNAAGLLSLGGKRQTGIYTLTTDINLGGAAMPTIGVDSDKGLAINGNGHTISNATTAHTSHNGMKHHGFFYVYSNSKFTISDLTFENITIDATNDTERNYGAGIVIAYADGGTKVEMNNVDIKNCHIKNNTPDIGDEAGVYVGYQTGTLTMNNCDSTGCSVAGETTVKTGAFIGMVNGTATLKNCTTDLTIGACNRIGDNATLTIE